jgi:hypothetical protein
MPVAGIVSEPIQSEGGDNFASPAFFQGLQDIAIEVITSDTPQPITRCDFKSAIWLLIGHCQSSYKDGLYVYKHWVVCLYFS